MKARSHTVLQCFSSHWLRGHSDISPGTGALGVTTGSPHPARKGLGFRGLSCLSSLTCTDLLGL